MRFGKEVVGQSKGKGEGVSLWRGGRGWLVWNWARPGGRSGRRRTLTFLSLGFGDWLGLFCARAWGRADGGGVVSREKISLDMRKGDFWEYG